LVLKDLSPHTFEDLGYRLFHKPVSQSTSQNFTVSMSSGTIDRMKVLAVKGIEKFGNLWEVRYTRMHGRNVQDAVFPCKSPEVAKAKYRELLDILQHHDGVYVGSKEKRNLKTSRRKTAS
jgi:hypothetical protein